MGEQEMGSSFDRLRTNGRRRSLAMTCLRQGFGGRAGDGFVLRQAQDEREKAEIVRDPLKKFPLPIVGEG